MKLNLGPVRTPLNYSLRTNITMPRSVESAACDFGLRLFRGVDLRGRRLGLAAPCQCQGVRQVRLCFARLGWLKILPKEWLKTLLSGFSLDLRLFCPWGVPLRLCAAWASQLAAGYLALLSHELNNEALLNGYEKRTGIACGHTD